MTRLELRFLGGLTIYRDGLPLAALKSQKGQALLCYLALTGKAHARSVLAGLLWPEMPEDNALMSLRTVLNKVNHHLAPHLAITRQTIAFQTGSSWVDVTEFEAGVTSRSDIGRLQAAVDLYQGDFLDGFDLPDAPHFDGWVLAQRAHLRQAALGGLHHLVTHFTDRGNHETAISYARQLLAIEPWQEETHRELMRLLAISGQRSAALVQYETCRAILAEELAVEPSAETEALYQAIRRGELSQGGQSGPIRGYKLKEKIGEGGYGTVYRAYQPAVGRDVAIKVIRPEYANDPDFIRRFETEAQTIAQLEHPHIVPLYDYWREPGGAYLVMRWLRGGSLKETLQRGLWPVERTLLLVDQMAAALDVAHRHAVVHRDLKPANILLDEEGNAYLSDFGIARRLTSDPTQSGFAGSPDYVSPEQILSEPVTPQSDIYTFGVVVYELLTGEGPFAGESLAGILHKHLYEPLPSVHARQPALPAAVDEVIQRATAKKPMERYPHPLAFAIALRQVLMVEALMPGRPYRRPGTSSTLAGAEELAAEQEGQPIAHNLPAESTPLIGRETELARLSQKLARPDGRLITIVGIGGIGKTRLALAVGEQQVSQPQNSHAFTDGVYFVPLAPLSEPDHILPTLAQAIDFQLQSNDPRAPEQQVLDFLKRKHMLLLFDNFEHLLDGASLLADILQAAPHVKVVVTSREPLRLYEEQVFPLEGLAFSEARATEADAAVQLFQQRARRVRPDFELHEADLPHLTIICRQVEGMPLALELAAAWVDTLPLADIAREVEQSLDLLETEWRNVPDRHRNMRVVFEASWQRLLDEEQHIFSRLSVFRGSFTRPAAWQVCTLEMSQPAFWRILATLVGKSFLRYDPTLDRYDLHELLRQFAAEKLAQKPDEETLARDHHSAYYCAFLHEHTDHWHTARQLETLAAVTREADNAQPALRWALAQGKWQRLVQAIDSWGWFHDWQGRYAAGESFCQAIVEQAERQTAGEMVVSPDSLRLWAKALAWQGWFTFPDNAILPLFQQSLALLAQLERAGQAIQQEKAFLLTIQGFILANQDLPSARRSHEQALTLYKELGNKWGIAQSLAGLGYIDWGTGHYASALDKLRSALAIQQERGDRRDQAHSTSTLGMVHRALGQLDEAERLPREALSLSQQLGDQSGLIAYRSNLAITLLLRGKFEEAHQLASESLALGQDLGFPLHEDWVRRTLGQTLLHMGQYQQARQQAAHSLALVTERRPVKDQILYRLLGDLALVASSYVEAQAAFAESAKISREEGDNLGIGLSLAGLGYTACGLGQWPQARQHLAEALATLLAIKAYMPAVYALPGVALLLAATGDAAHAVEIWALARRHPYIANSKWFEDVAGRELEGLAATLPPEVAKAARERGQRLDLWPAVEALLAELEVTKVAGR